MMRDKRRPPPNWIERRLFRIHNDAEEDENIILLGFGCPEKAIASASRVRHYRNHAARI